MPLERKYARDFFTIFYNITANGVSFASSFLILLQKPTKPVFE